jgi:hypothetical protein
VPSEGQPMTVDTTDLQFFEIKFSPDELKTLPKQHSAYLVATCFAINEVLVFLRLKLQTLNSMKLAEPDERLASVAFMQDQILTRTLSGKVVEYLKLIRDHRKICLRAKDPDVQSFFSEHGEEIDALWNTAGTRFAHEIRNNLGSHIGLGRIRQTVAALPSGRTTMGIYLHPRDGNTIYPIGEDVAHIAAFDTSEDVQQWLDWVLDTCRFAQRLHNKYMIWIVETFFSEKHPNEIRISVDKRLVSDFQQAIPILWEFSTEKG